MNSLLEAGSLSGALGLVALALIPVALVTLTSFAKISVVFSALRNALGTPDVPSGTVITALALALSVYVMAPVVERIEVDKLTAQSDLSALFARASEPLRSFLARNAGERETKLFVDLAKERGEVATASDLRVLWASFAITELKRAFQLGFFVFLPFLVLDLVVAQILLTLGMNGLTPSAVALPFKLLLFVSVDGFLLVSRALILGYA
ncbi:MAG: flagellar type III secretion system pore protein FliP [Myxococcales bacterium]